MFVNFYAKIYRQAALFWSYIDGIEDFSWKTLLDVRFIRLWVYWWDKRAESGEISWKSPQNRMTGLVEVSNKML